MNEKMLGNVLIVVLQLVQCSISSNDKSQNWKVVENWPKYDNFGQISGVSIDTYGNVYVFHRGNRVWDSTSFYVNNTFRNQAEGAISQETMIVLDPVSGEVKKKTGSGKFYMPHGLTLDHMNNVWVTDVALHQVFKFSPIINSTTQLSKPEMTLGQAFIPGNDEKHFCKPTDVAIDKVTGDFYISDGYCNSRIIKYDKKGNVLLSWGRSSYLSIQNQYDLNVPHALSLGEDETLFVADRENFRSLAYSSITGKFKQSFPSDKRIYSVAYSSAAGKHLYTLSNSSYPSQGEVSVYDLENGKILYTFAPPNGFSNPHDLAVTPDGKTSYVVELSPTKVWKFHFDEVIEAESNKIKKVNSDPLVNESKLDRDFFSGTLLAVGVVSFVIFIIFLTFIFHMHKKKGGYSQYEMRRLILDEEEEVSINVS